VLINWTAIPVERTTTRLFLNPVLFDNHLKSSINGKFTSTLVKNRFMDSSGYRYAIGFDPANKSVFMMHPFMPLNG
jgi:hypothetical protein